MNEQVIENLNNLESAFRDFDVLARDLSSSYQSLDSTVTRFAHQISSEGHQQGSLEQIETTEQNRRLRGLLDAIPLAVLVIDQAGIIRYSNQSVRDYFGEPMTGKVWRDHINNGSVTVNGDGEIVFSNGRKVLVSTNPLGYEPGQVIVLYDNTITSNLKSMAHQFDLSSLVRKINATLAHQIRTPLTSTLLYAGQLKNNIHDEKSRSCLNRIISNIEHLEEITQNLLGGITGTNEQVEYTNIQRIFSELKEVVKPLEVKANVNLSVEGGNRGILIKCNKDMFKSILLNIIINAMQSCIEKREKHRYKNSKQSELSDELYVTLTLNEVESGMSGNIIAIEVTDNGIGINEENLETIFNPYYTTKSGGTGLGLSVAKTVVKSMGGSIMAGRHMSVGAKIILNIPYYTYDQQG